MPFFISTDKIQVHLGFDKIDALELLELNRQLPQFKQVRFTGTIFYFSLKIVKSVIGYFIR